MAGINIPKTLMNKFTGGDINSLGDINGKPIAPNFQYAGTQGGAGMQLAGLPGFTATPGTDTRYIEQMRDTALRDPGTQSKWRQLAGQNLTADAASQAALAQKQNQAQMNQMAMRGGLRSGAAERMGQQANLNAMRASQGVLGQKYGLDLQDEQMRQQQLGALGGQEMALGQQGMGAQQFNITNRLNELLQQRKFEADKYREQMQAWASERTAAATPSSGGGGKK